MKFLFDVLPFILFYAAYVKWDIYVATAVAIAVSALQIVVTLISGRKVQTMQWVAMVLIAVFGGMALYLQNPMFIMWRSSIINWLLAAVLVVSLVVLKRNPVQLLLRSQITMPDFAWRQLAWGMVLLFSFMGLLNIVIAKNFSEAVWVNYKTFGSPIISIVFFIGMMLLLSKHVSEPADSPAKPPQQP